MGRKKSLNLTEGELPLMQALWEKGRATVGDVVAALPADPPLAYSTVLTTLRILEAKGYVRHTKEGRAFVYEPVVIQEEASRMALDTLVNRFFGGSCELLVLNLLKEEAIGPAEIGRIKKIVPRASKEGRNDARQLCNGNSPQRNLGGYLPGGGDVALSETASAAEPYNSLYCFVGNLARYRSADPWTTHTKNLHF